MSIPYLSPMQLPRIVLPLHGAGTKDKGYMCYLKVFRKNLGMGEWAPPFFPSSSATPPGGFGRASASHMGGRGVDNLVINPVNIGLTRPGTVWMHSIYSCESFSFTFALRACCFSPLGGPISFGFSCLLSFPLSYWLSSC